MSASDDRPRDSAGRQPLSDRDLAIATLVGRYIERRESGRAPYVQDLFAVAQEFGEVAVDALRTLLACYEAMRTSNDLTPVRSEEPR